MEIGGKLVAVVLIITACGAPGPGGPARSECQDLALREADRIEDQLD